MKDILKKYPLEYKELNSVIGNLFDYINEP